MNYNVPPRYPSSFQQPRYDRFESQPLASEVQQVPFENSKSVHVAGLHESVDETLLSRIFSIVGHVVSCKIMKDKTGTHARYGFIEFIDHTTAEFAKENMNGRLVYGKELKVNWTHDSQSDAKGSFKLFVGGLHTEVTNEILYQNFAKFGRVSDARVLRYSQSGKSQGYGFVTFIRKEDAETAMQMMNGEKIQGRTVKVNWGTATQKPTETVKRGFDEISRETSNTNNNVYVGGIPKETEESTMRKLFGDFGEIIDLKIMRTDAEKAYGFVRFVSHDNATKAIMMLNGYQLNGGCLNCMWGKESFN
ncbi:nucleolysin TIA-1, putative [Entamoeba invadens IP1]|uniref:nucleolysin TIA-1, putative n=1 Tax=Entamoeba invadens IP1 TaxID=370355 RepID=UPI0002C3E511|nr:nucleolysin TIA-1, putative [Entamoeba invadens IP1]ELP90622.1 nucleolysin TIA-1, putative [Entamoeba invadens IP1]|eukprot:XP_004257393.1 nucleolysin TIA-1, putative [Entamoeba invadens IP1]